MICLLSPFFRFSERPKDLHIVIPHLTDIALSSGLRGAFGDVLNLLVSAYRKPFDPIQKFNVREIPDALFKVSLFLYYHTQYWLLEQHAIGVESSYLCHYVYDSLHSICAAALTPILNDKHRIRTRLVLLVVSILLSSMRGSFFCSHILIADYYVSAITACVRLHAVRLAHC